MHDRRDRVEEGQRVRAGALADRFRERGRGQRAGGDDDAVPVLRRQPGDLLARNRYQRMRFERRRDRGGKTVAVDRERAARRHLMGVGRAHHQRAEPAHLLVQEADGIVLAIVGAERVGADEFRELVALVHGGRAHRPHLMQHHGDAARRDLPRRFRAGEAAADDVNGFGHPAK